jgi:endonuclease YncB( thermonuclease family)
MARFQSPYYRARRNGWPGRRPTFLVMVSLLCLTAFYALGRRHIERLNIAPRAPIAGHAWVVDGDSIRIAGVSIRLEGIDAPEWDQSCRDPAGRTWLCGRAASNALRELTRGQTLTCLPRARDRYGRVVATCSLPNGTDLNAWMVRQGWAIASGFSNIYRSEEAEAKAQQRGIWSGSFIYPAEWRRQKAHDRGR